MIDEPGVASPRRGRGGPGRTPWRDFPKAVILSPAKDIQRRTDYRPAKEGSTEAAYRLARDVVSDEHLATIRKAVEDCKPIVTAVHAEEKVSVNKIPHAYAHQIADRLGYDLDESIVQAQKIGRGGSDGFYRLANQPEFAGEVESGRDYVIVDDTLTQGGTIAALKGYIENRGGRVILASTLMGKQYSATLKPSQTTLQEVRERHGQDFDQWWREQFGHGLDRLTESELRYLARVKVPSTDALRHRLLAARQARDDEASG